MRMLTHEFMHVTTQTKAGNTIFAKASMLPGMHHSRYALDWIILLAVLDA